MKTLHKSTESTDRVFSGLYFPVFGLQISKLLYSVRMQQNMDQKNSVLGHFSRSEMQWMSMVIL